MTHPARARRRRHKAAPAPPASLPGIPPVLNRPDAESQARLPLREISAEGIGRGTVLEILAYVRAYTLGECSVLVTKTPRIGWHLSIAHDSRYPTWDEIAQARYRLLPEGIWCAMYLPPPEEYVNLHRFCFQIQQCPEPGPVGA